MQQPVAAAASRRRSIWTSISSVLVLFGLLACDLLKLKGDSTGELVVVKTIRAEGSIPRYTANIRISNAGNESCRLMSYELDWQGGKKPVVLDPTPMIEPGEYVLKDVPLGMFEDPEALSSLSGNARCVPE